MPVTIFTTNYDLLMEQAFEDLGVPYFDGFVGARHPFFDLHAIEEDELPSRWARFWKIHGSVNWHQSEEGVRRGDTSGDLLVFPSHLKYDQSRRMPYLAMMDQLRAFLKRSGAVLITCGYSFGDQHINDVIVQGLQGNSSAMVFGLVYGNLDPKLAIVSVATRRGNLAILARDAAVIGRKIDVWEGPRDETSKDRLPPIEWTATGASGTLRPEFRLGDFARFGAFVERLSRDYRRMEHA
jgi:hypothetical protein